MSFGLQETPHIVSSLTADKSHDEMTAHDLIASLCQWCYRPTEPMNLSPYCANDLIALLSQWSYRSTVPMILSPYCANDVIALLGQFIVPLGSWLLASRCIVIISYPPAVFSTQNKSEENCYRISNIYDKYCLLLRHYKQTISHCIAQEIGWSCIEWSAFWSSAWHDTFLEGIPHFWKYSNPL